MGCGFAFVRVFRGQQRISYGRGGRQLSGDGLTMMPSELPAVEGATLARWIELLDGILIELDDSGLAVPAIHLSHSIELLKQELGSAS